MAIVHPVLCHGTCGGYGALLPPQGRQGEAWRATFRARIATGRYRLIARREIIERQGICALFHPGNLRVLYLSKRLAGVLPQLTRGCDADDFQRIHDQVTRRLSPQAGNGHRFQLPEFWLLLLELLENGFLREDRPDKGTAAQDQGRYNRFTSLIILPSLSCNFRCDYCYHRGIPRSEKTAPVLPFEKVQRGIDYFLANTSVPEHVRRSIRFTGGEPMRHYELIRGTFDYVREIRRRNPNLAPFKLSMVTNAALADEKWVALIKEHGVVVAVSLDGRKPRNDLRRRSLTGSAYVESTTGIRRLNRAGIRPTVFTTVSSHNIDSLSEDIAWLFDHFDLAAFSFNLDTSFLAKYRVAPADYVNGIIRAYDELSRRGLFDVKVTRISEKFQSKGKAVSGCGGVFSHVAMFPDGSIGPCPRLAGDATQRMEIADTRELGASPLFREWATFDYSLNRTCRRCHYRNICEGWCPYLSKQLTGRLSEPNDYNCLFTKKLLEWLIWYDYDRALEGRT